MCGTTQKITIVIPTLNEEKHIAQTIDMLSRDQGFSDYDVIICDGGSSDATLTIARNLGYQNVRVVNNPKRTQAAAVNYVAELIKEHGRTEYLIRVDAHSEYPEDFITRLVMTAKSCGADSVVVPMRTMQGNNVQKAAHILFNSWLGNGGAAHRAQSKGQWVDHGHHALFRLEAFLNVGGYDEAFIANEDAELDYRLIQAGYRIYLDGDNAIGYIPRDSVFSTWKQMRRNGFYRLKNVTKHRIRLKMRQILPILVLPFLLSVFLLAVFTSPIALVLSLVYFAPVAVLSWRACGRTGVSSIMLRVMTFILAVTTHLGFSFGAAEFVITHFKKLLFLGRRP